MILFASAIDKAFCAVRAVDAVPEPLPSFLTMASPSMSRDIDLEAQPPVLQPHPATNYHACYYPQC